MQNEWTETIDRLHKENAALHVQLEAWHKVFGTTQLDHAQARLQRAEEGVVRLNIHLDRVAAGLARLIGVVGSQP